MADHSATYSPPGTPFQAAINPSVPPPLPAKAAPKSAEGSITRAIRARMLASELSTRQFGRMAGLITGLLILVGVFTPAVPIPKHATQALASRISRMTEAVLHESTPELIVLSVLAAIGAVFFGCRTQGMQRAKALFWLGFLGMVSLLGGSPTGIGGTITLVLVGVTGMLVAARLRMNFPDSMLARILGAASAGFIIVVLAIPGNGQHLVELSFGLLGTSNAIGILLVLAVIPVTLSLINSESHPHGVHMAMVVWFLTLGLLIVGALLLTLEYRINGFKTAAESLGIMGLFVVGLTDLLGHILLKKRGDLDIAVAQARASS